MKGITTRPRPSITDAKRFLGHITQRRVAEVVAEVLPLGGSLFTITEKEIGMIRDPEYPFSTAIEDNKRFSYLTDSSIADFGVHYDSWGPGESVRLHIHERNAEYLLYLGHAEVTVGDRQPGADHGVLYTFEVKPGTIVGVPKKFPHMTWNHTGDRLEILSISVPAQQNRDRTNLDEKALESRGWLRRKELPTQYSAPAL